MILDLPIPFIFAPAKFKKLHNSFISGSLAAFIILVVPVANTAANIMF